MDGINGCVEITEFKCVIDRECYDICKYYSENMYGNCNHYKNGRCMSEEARKNSNKQVK